MTTTMKGHVMDLQTSKRIYKFIEDNYDQYMEVIAPAEDAPVHRSKVVCFCNWAADEITRITGRECTPSLVSSHKLALHLIRNVQELKEEDVSDIPFLVLARAQMFYVPKDDLLKSSGISYVEAVDTKFKWGGSYLLLDWIMEVLHAYRAGTHRITASDLENITKTIRRQIKQRKYMGAKQTFRLFMQEHEAVASEPEEAVSEATQLEQSITSLEARLWAVPQIQQPTVDSAPSDRARADFEKWRAINNLIDFLREAN